MTWLVILVVLAAAFAPVAYMMPSKRDRALSSLRMVARREGLEVAVTHLPKLGAEAHERVSASGKLREAQIDCVSYGLRLPKRQLQPVRYRLLRLEGTQFPVIAGSSWELDRKFQLATAIRPDPGYWEVLAEIESLLPEDVLGLAVTEDFVLCYWRERLKAAAEKGRNPEALVADIRELLNKVAFHHNQHFPPPAAHSEPESPA